MQVQLKVIGGKQNGQLISINRPKFMIGRADDCQLKSKNELISRYHCVLLTEEGYVGVRDLGSRNGVFVNGEKIDEETELRNADRLMIGPLEFEVVIAVAMSAGKRPKVETIADVVARTVEQSSLSAVAKEGGDVSSWLLEGDEPEASPVEPTIVMKLSEDADVPEEENILDRLAEKKYAQGSPAAPKTAAAAAVNEPVPDVPKEAASKRQEPKKPEPVLNLNLDEEDYAPAPQQKPEKKSATSTHKKAPPASHAAENLKNFFQNH